MTPETFTALAEELDAVEGVIFQMQQACEAEGAMPVSLAPHDAPNVHHMRPSQMMPGPQWQALEAMKGLVWVLRQVCEELRGARHD